MRKLRLMADYDCSPLWESGAADYNVDPDALPISQRLRSDLVVWAAQYDRILDRDDPATGTGFTDAGAAERWLCTGAELAVRLREELGPEGVDVEYFHESTDPASLLRET